MQNRKFFIGIAISIALLILFLTTSDLMRMLKSLGTANYLYVGPAVIVYLLSLFFRTIRWQLMMEHIKPISITSLYPVVIIGYMANNLLPFRIGEIVRTYYLNQREGVSQTSALASILVERVLDAMTLLLFVGIVAQFAPLETLTNGLSEWVGVPPLLLIVCFSVPFILSMALLMLIASQPTTAKHTIPLLAGLVSNRLAQKVSNLVELFIIGLTPLSRPSTLMKLLVLSLPIWLLESILFLFIAYSFDINTVYKTFNDMLMAMIVVTSVSNIGSSIPAAPGGIGLFEIVTRETLVLLPFGDIQRPIAAAFATVTHATLLIPVIVIGQVLLWKQHVSLKMISLDSLKFFQQSSDSNGGTQ